MTYGSAEPGPGSCISQKKPARGGRGSLVAPSRGRTSFSCSASHCQSFQPRVTMAITTMNHRSDRSLSRPALTRSSCRWCTGFLQYAGPSLCPCSPAAGAQGPQRIVYLPDPGVDTGGRKWVRASCTLSMACIRKDLRRGPRSHWSCQWWPWTRA